MPIQRGQNNDPYGTGIAPPPAVHGAQYGADQTLDLNDLGSAGLSNTDQQYLAGLSHYYNPTNQAAATNAQNWNAAMAPQAASSPSQTVANGNGRPSSGGGGLSSLMNLSDAQPGSQPTSMYNPYAMGAQAPESVSAPRAPLPQVQQARDQMSQGLGRLMTQRAQSYMTPDRMANLDKVKNARGTMEQAQAAWGNARQNLRGM